MHSRRSSVDKRLFLAIPMISVPPHSECPSVSNVFTLNAGTRCFLFLKRVTRKSHGPSHARALVCMFILFVRSVRPAVTIYIRTDYLHTRSFYIGKKKPSKMHGNNPRKRYKYICTAGSVVPLIVITFARDI